MNRNTTMVWVGWIMFTAVAALLPAGTAFPADRGIRVSARTPAGGTRQIPLYTGYHALVVACAAYTGGWPPLEAPLDDAKAVAAALKKLGFAVERVDNPDGPTLRRVLNGLVAKAARNPDRAVFVYFAGHGHTLEQADGKKLGYIVPVDAPDPETDLAGFMSRAVSMREVEQLSTLIRARHVLMAFDSCFSGAIFRAGPERASPFIREQVASPVRAFIAAGNEKERVPDASVFKTVLIQGLSGRYADLNADGYVTGEELGFYLRQEVINYTNGAQHPHYGRINNPSLDKGDFVFVLPEPEKPPVPPPPADAGDLLGAFEKRARQREAERRRWAAYQERMKASFEKASLLGKGTDLTAAEKTSMWEKVLSAFAADNPHSDLDDELRKLGENSVQLWKNMAKVEMFKAALENVEAGKPAAMETFSAPGAKPGPKAGDEWTEPVTGMKFVWVPGGCFQMGQTDAEKRYLVDEVGEKDYKNWYADETPRHEVCVDGFWMGKTEVTNAQFRKFRPGHDSQDYHGNSLNGDNQPAVYVSWEDARAMAVWMSKGAGGKFRLPSEAEWEYACRAGMTTSRFWGDDADDACRYGNVADRTARRKWANWMIHNCDDGHAATAPAGSFQPNPFGLYDMLGNAWEWCEDIYSEDAYRKHERNNPIYTGGGVRRVLRGGSWNFGPVDVRCAFRDFYRMGNWFHGVGFRLVRPVQ